MNIIRELFKILMYIIPYKLMMWIFEKLGDKLSMDVRLRNKDDFETLYGVDTSFGYIFIRTKDKQIKHDLKLKKKELKNKKKELESLIDPKGE